MGVAPSCGAIGTLDRNTAPRLDLKSKKILRENTAKRLQVLRHRPNVSLMTTATTPQERPQPSPQVLAGRTLRMMREAHGVSLRDLASRVDISPSHLSRVESGERAAGPDLTDRICAVIAELPAPGKKAS